MQQAFDALVREVVAPFLKSHGYKKDGLTFRKSGNGLVYLLNLQKSQGNTAQEVRFYVNCGIYAPAIDEGAGNAALQRPKEYECHYRNRLENITGRREQWFALAPGTSFEEVGQCLHEELCKALAFFGSVDTLEGLLSVYNTDAGVLLHYLLATGNRAMAQRVLQQQQAKFGAEARWPRMRDRLAKICTQYGFGWEG